MVSERLKYINNHSFYANKYFWRTKQQQEIDYIEEYDEKIHAYIFKLNPNKSLKLPKTFTNAYQNTEFKIINPDNYLSFICSTID